MDKLSTVGAGSDKTHLSIFVGDVGYIDSWETGSEHYPLFSSDGSSGVIDFSTEE